MTSAYLCGGLLEVLMLALEVAVDARVVDILLPNLDAGVAALLRREGRQERRDVVRVHAVDSAGLQLLEARQHGAPVREASAWPGIFFDHRAVDLHVQWHADLVA